MAFRVVPSILQLLISHTVTSYPLATTYTAISLVYATVTATEIALGYPSTLTTTITGNYTWPAS
jgi:hypothetical protein